MAEYDLKKKPAFTTKEGETAVLYPSIVHCGKLTTEKLAQLISERSTFTPGDIEGLLKELVNVAGEYIGEGYIVELGDFGTFTGKLKARRLVADKKEMRSTSISFNGVNFRASKKFKSMAVGTLSRADGRSFKHSSAMSEEERKRRLLAHIEKNGFIRRKDYTLLTGRLKDLALKDLKKFKEEGLIQSCGRGNQLYFIKATIGSEEAGIHPNP